MAKKKEYVAQDIVMLKGADRVRKKPSVIFGSDGIEGCQHAIFEILSNSIDEAREGYGNTINVTVYKDKTIEVEDFGRGIPLDWNEKSSDTTGSLFSVSFMPAVSTTTMLTVRTSIHWVQTVLAHVQLNTPPNLWALRHTYRVSNMTCTFRRASLRVNFQK